MKNNLIIVGVVLAVVLSVVGLLSKGSTEKIIERVVERVGALPGPDITSDYLSVNGVRLWYYHSALQTATQTPCSFKTPAATTTVEFASIRFNTSSTSASYVYIGKGAVRTATTTILGQAPLTANQKGTIIATTTPLDALDEDKVIAPSQWVNFGMKATEANSGGTFSPVGACNLRLIEN